jgi:AmmeMemoRadiSam system protein B
MARKPAVAGQFYPDTERELRAAIASYCPADAVAEPALGAVCPHAGYVFSGPVAGRLFASVRVPDAVVLLMPSHHFDRPPFALWTDGAWQTPLGDMDIHPELTQALAALPMVTEDDRPHLPEHSGEVVVPFIQYRNPGARMAAVCVTVSAKLQALKEFGEALAGLLRDAGCADALVVASSDMSHEQGPQALATVQAGDSRAIEAMTGLDPERLYHVCRGEGVTMCGVLPATAALTASLARGAGEGRLVARATSADSPFGRGSYVVGYAGLVFK